MCFQHFCEDMWSCGQCDKEEIFVFLLNAVWLYLFLLLRSWFNKKFLRLLECVFSLYVNQSPEHLNPSCLCSQCCWPSYEKKNPSPLLNPQWTINTFEMLSLVKCKIILLFCWRLYVARFKCCSETPFHLYAQYSLMASSQFPVPQRNHFIVILELALVFHQEAKHMLEQLTLAPLSI